MKQRGLISRSLSLALGAAVLALCAPAASAQWLSLTKDNARFKQANGSAATYITSDTDEKDYGVADVDQDGDQDLAIVRKIPNSFIGPRVAYLMMNESGNLVDRTTQYAADSDVDTGFNTPQDSRDIEFGDLTGDGWLDFVQTQTDLVNKTAAADKKNTHPRVFRNKASTGGAWNGFKHEDTRIPQLKTVGGINGIVRFCDNALGDYDNDGDLDLYFVDYDTDENGHSEPSSNDLNDRMLRNDGAGFFTDVTFSIMTLAMYDSKFGTECSLADMNGDGRLDVTKITTLTESPNRTEVIYNDANAGGTTLFDVQQNAHTGQDYTKDEGDLNNDGMLDMFFGDDGTDVYKFNTGNDGLGQVVWSSTKTPTYSAGATNQGFPGQLYIHDFNLDGWNDVAVSDVDLDLSGCSRVTYLFRNQTGTPGSTNIGLTVVGNDVDGWDSAYPTGTSGDDGYPKGVFDFGIIDLDNDGDEEIILGKCTGTDLWINEAATPSNCQAVIGLGGVGSAHLSVCGGDLSTGTTADLSITGGTPNGQAMLLVSLSTSPVPAFGGTIWTIPLLTSIPVPLNANGEFTFTVQGGGGPADVYVQAIAFTGSGHGVSSLTEAIKISLLP